MPEADTAVASCSGEQLKTRLAEAVGSCLPGASDTTMCLQQPSKLILDTLRSKLFRLTVPQLLAAGTHAPEPEPAPPEVLQQPEPVERHAGPLQVCEAYGPELKGLLAYDGMATSRFVRYISRTQPSKPSSRRAAS